MSEASEVHGPRKPSGQFKIWTAEDVIREWLCLLLGIPFRD